MNAPGTDHPDRAPSTEDTDAVRWSIDCRWSIQFPGALFLLLGLVLIVLQFVKGKSAIPEDGSHALAAFAAAVACIYGATILVLGQRIKRGSIRAAVLLAVTTWPLFAGWLLRLVVALVSSRDAAFTTCGEVVFSGYMVLSAHYAIHRCRRMARRGAAPA
jgi:hypothetical protein